LITPNDIWCLIPRLSCMCIQIQWNTLIQHCLRSLPAKDVRII
jgi:hypothetical protein